MLLLPGCSCFNSSLIKPDFKIHAYIYCVLHISVCGYECILKLVDVLPVRLCRVSSQKLPASWIFYCNSTIHYGVKVKMFVPGNFYYLYMEYDPMNCSTPGLPVHHQLPEFIQTHHAHRVDNAIQRSHPLSSPSPPAPNPSQHQGLFQ